MKFRSLAAAVGLATTMAIGVPSMTALGAGPEVQVEVPASTIVTQSKPHPCLDRPSVQCTATITVHFDAHREFHVPGAMPGAATPVRACWSRYYKWGWVAWTENGGFGNLLWKATENVQDWYNGCQSGNVYIDNHCQGGSGWTCDMPPPHASVWDGLNNANSDWTNQYTTYAIPKYGILGYYETELRYWTRSNGSSFWWSQSYCIWC